MIRTIFILGAGASRAAGAPLMSDFIQKCEEIRRARNPPWAKQDFEWVAKGRRELTQAYAKSSVDIDNIEQLFSVFEMAKLLEQLGDFDAKEVQLLPRRLKFVIINTLEELIRFSLYLDQQYVAAPKPYDAFTELLGECNESRTLGPVAVMTFNYDLSLDYALTAAGIAINYGVESSLLTEGSMALLKPHGSLNWAVIPGSDNIQIIPVKLIPTETIRRRLGIFHSVARPLGTMELLYGPHEWGAALMPEPLIVPPTWSKERYQETLSSVWRLSGKVLSHVENVFVIGYSLPPSDQFFRSFFALSTMSEAIIDRFWLFDPADSGVAERFHSLLGPAVSKRNGFRHIRATFSEAILSLAQEFRFDEERLKGMVQRADKLG